MGIRGSKGRGDRTYSWTQTVSHALHPTSKILGSERRRSLVDRLLELGEYTPNQVENPMVQAQFSLDETLWQFIQKSEAYGFRNREELVWLALTKLQKELEQLEASADLYAEEYQADLELKVLTNSAIVGWEE